MKTDMDINEKRRAEVSQSLAHVLADTYVLYFKTHQFHWNVTGPFFHSFHALFEAQYKELFAALDTLAERIRATNCYAPTTSVDLVRLARLKEEPEIPEADEMVRILMEDHAQLARSIRSTLEIIAETNDEGTVDLLVGRLQEHEKAAWMLKSSLRNEQKEASPPLKLSA